MAEMENEEVMEVPKVSISYLNVDNTVVKKK